MGASSPLKLALKFTLKLTLVAASQVQTACR
jgi:hypothetical protein